MIGLGADSNEQVKGEHALLIQAIEHGGKKTVMLLINMKADVNVRDNTKSGWTPLIRALLSGRNEYIPWLLKAGADPNIKDSTGLSPSMIAADLGCITALKQLYRAGADLLELCAAHSREFIRG